MFSLNFFSKVCKLPFLVFSHFFRPSLRIKNINEVKIQELFLKGYRGILLDLDNTILPRAEKLINQNFIDWLNELQKIGFKVAIVSNNFHKNRLNQVFKQTNLAVVNPAFKPLPFGLKIALKKIKVPAKNTIVIGDQITTDIVGGNLLGCYTILTEPLDIEIKSWRKFMQNLDRIVEKLFLS